MITPEEKIREAALDAHMAVGCTEPMSCHGEVLFIEGAQFGRELEKSGTKSVEELIDEAFEKKDW